MNWDKEADDYATRHHTYEHLGYGENMRFHKMFVKGAKWQRDEIRTDEAVERVARGLYEARPHSFSWEEILDGWRNKPYQDYPHTVDDLLAEARVAITALLGEEP